MPAVFRNLTRDYPFMCVHTLLPYPFTCVKWRGPFNLRMMGDNSSSPADQHARPMGMRRTCRWAGGIKEKKPIRTILPFFFACHLAIRFRNAVHTGSAFDWALGPAMTGSIVHTHQAAWTAVVSTAAAETAQFVASLSVSREGVSCPRLCWVHFARDASSTTALNRSCSCTAQFAGGCVVDFRSFAARTRARARARTRTPSHAPTH